jgi:competence protein ComEC
MFISGLGHVLSISGYHMAVVAGVVFFAVRALLALIPALTVAFPLKKWAVGYQVLGLSRFCCSNSAKNRCCYWLT